MAVGGRNFLCEIRGRPTQPLFEAQPLPRKEGRLFEIGRRQIKAQDIPDPIKSPRIQKQYAVEIITARPCAGWCDNAAQKRGDFFRIERKFQNLIIAGDEAFTGLQLQKLVGVNGQIIGFERGRG